MNQNRVDTLPYQTFLKLKDKYPVKTVVLTEGDMSMPGVHLAYRDHREFVEAHFKKIGVHVLRHAHNYASLSGRNPELGIVYLANDSVINPGLEAHVLIGHNARYVNAG